MLDVFRSRPVVFGKLEAFGCFRLSFVCLFLYVLFQKRIFFENLASGISKALCKVANVAGNFIRQFLFCGFFAIFVSVEFFFRFLIFHLLVIEFIHFCIASAAELSCVSLM